MKIPLIVVGSLLASAAQAASVSKGTRYYNESNYPKAIAELQPLAESGDRDAMYYLARSMRAQQRKERGGGYHVPDENDPVQQQSHVWFGKAADLGHIDARVESANDLDLGYGVQVDYARALELMQSAHDAGSKPAGAKLEGWYRDGHIVKPDLAKAAALLAERPKAQDLQQSIIALSSTLRQAQDKLKGSDAGSDERAALAGDAEAAWRLAESFNRASTTPDDCRNRERWYLRAGELGIAEAYYRWGVDLSRGSCGQQDLARARQMFLLGAMNGYWSAMGELARNELFGHSGAPDYRAAYVHQSLYHQIKNIKDDPGPVNFARRQMKADEIATADAEIASLLPKLMAMDKRRTEQQTRRPMQLTSKTASSNWSYSLAMVDDSGRCARNYLDNCSYVPFRIALEVNNKSDVTQVCNLALKARVFPATELTTFERRYVLMPGSSRKPAIGSIAGDVDATQSTMDCESVPQPSMETNTCLMQFPAGAAPPYPKQAIKDKVEGTTRLTITVPRNNAKPSVVSMSASSGSADLDDAAMAFVKNQTMETNCPGVEMIMPLAFKLQ
jgi:TonB family protein